MALTSLHTKANHPTKHQMRQIMNRYFFTAGLDHKIDELLSQCSLCTSLKKFPKETARSTTSKPPSFSGTHMNTDIIKRAGQNIMVTMDPFSNYITTTLVNSETKEDLANGIITTTTPIRLSSKIMVWTDRAPALQALARQGNHLSTIGINIVLPKNAFNKNANCHVDRIIQELEMEIKKLSPMGKPLHPADLAKATLSLNSKIRQSGLTASEAHFSRDSATLDQIPPAKAPDWTPPTHKEAHAISPGDTVYIKSQGGKHHV